MFQYIKWLFSTPASHYKNRDRKQESFGRANLEVGQ